MAKLCRLAVTATRRTRSFSEASKTLLGRNANAPSKVNRQTDRQTDGRTDRRADRQPASQPSKQLLSRPDEHIWPVALRKAGVFVKRASEIYNQSFSKVNLFAFCRLTQPDPTQPDPTQPDSTRPNPTRRDWSRLQSSRVADALTQRLVLLLCKRGFRESNSEETFAFCTSS